LIHLFFIIHRLRISVFHIGSTHSFDGINNKNWIKTRHGRRKNMNMYDHRGVLLWKKCKMTSMFFSMKNEYMRVNYI